MDQKTRTTLEKIKKAKEIKERKIKEEIKANQPPDSDYRKLAQSFL